MAKMRLRDRLIVAGALGAGAGLMAVTEVHREWSAERMEAEALLTYGEGLSELRSDVQELSRIAYIKKDELNGLDPSCAIVANNNFFRPSVATIVNEPCPLTTEQVSELRNFAAHYDDLYQTSTSVHTLLRDGDYLGELDARIADGRSASYWDIIDTEGLDSRDAAIYYTTGQYVGSVPLDSYEKSAQEYTLEFLLVFSGLGVALDARRQVRYLIIRTHIRHMMKTVQATPSTYGELRARRSTEPTRWQDDEPDWGDD